MTAQLGLTYEQARCLGVIRKSFQDRGIPPTYSEMAAALGLRSKSGVHRLLSALTDRGHVKRGGTGRARTIALVDPDDAGMVEAITDLEERAIARRLLRTAAALREARQIAQAEEVPA